MSWLVGHDKHFGLCSFRLSHMKLLISDHFYNRSSNFIWFNFLLEQEGIGNSQYSRVIDFEKLTLILDGNAIRQGKK